MLEVRKDLPANTLPEFAALLKQHGGHNAVRLGQRGLDHASCMLAAQFAQVGADVTHGPVSGLGAATNDLIGGQIDYVCGNLGAAIALIQGKQVKALALLSKERSPLMPELPTAHEQGVPDYDVTTWTAFFAAEGHAEGDHRQTERGHARRDGYAGDQEPDDRDRGCRDCA